MMDGQKPHPPAQSDSTEVVPPYTISEEESLSASRPTAPTTIMAGSLPEQISWQPFHARYPPHLAVPHSAISGSLGNAFLTPATPGHCAYNNNSNNYYCPTHTSSIVPPPSLPTPYYSTSSSLRTDFQPIFVSSHIHSHGNDRTHSRPLEPHSAAPIPRQTIPHYVHQPSVSSYGLPHLTSSLQQPFSSVQQRSSTVPDIPHTGHGKAVDAGQYYNETTPLLMNSPPKKGYGGHSGTGKRVSLVPEVEEENCERRGSSGEHSSRLHRFDRKQIVILAAMLVTIAVAFASLSIMAPFFPRQAEKLKLGETTEGVIFSIYPCVMFITTPIIGKLLPLFKPRIVYLLGIFLTGVSTMLFGTVSLVHTPDAFVSLSIVLRLLAALGTSCFTTVMYAIIPILFPENVNMVNGMVETSIGIGLCLGPAVGMWLYGMGGFPMPFVGLGAFILLTAFVNCVAFPDDEIWVFVNHGTRTVGSVLARRRTVLSLLILCVTAICYATLYPTLQPHMHKLGITTEGVCMIYLLMGAVYCLSAPIVGLVIDKVGGMDWVMLIGLILTALSFVLIGNSPILPPAVSHHELYLQDIAGVVVSAVSSAMCIVPTYASILKASSCTGEVDMGTYSVIGGLWSASYSLGEMLGPLYAGLLADYITFASATTITALMPTALAVVFGAFMCGNYHRRSSLSRSSSNTTNTTTTTSTTVTSTTPTSATTTTTTLS